MNPAFPAVERARSKGDVLFISRQRLIGRTNGSSVYLLDLAQAVRRAGFTPHLLQPSPDLMGRWPFMRLRPEMAVFESHAIRGVFRVGSWVLTRDPGVGVAAVRAVATRLARQLGLRGAWLADRPRPYVIAANWTKADRAFVKAKAADHFETVILDYAFQSEALVDLPGRRSAIVMHDVFHSRADSADAARDSVTQIDRKTEIALLSRADAVIAIQADEARFLATHVPGTHAILAPMAAHPVSRPQAGHRDRLLFVGSNTAPNIVGLEWLFAHVWPVVRRRRPQLRLDIAGTVAAAFPRGGPAGVTFHGLVDDLQALYTQAGVVIAPLTFGSGLKIKLVEALAHGKAIVATSVTLQGVEIQCAGAVIQADDPGVFANGVLSLQDDVKRRELATAALAAARTHFSAQACHADFVAWLDAAGAQAAPETVTVQTA